MAESPSVPERAGSGMSAEGSRIVRNSALLTVGSFAGLILGFVSTLIITDRLGDDYGLLIGAQRFVVLFLMVASFGLHPLLVRSLAAGHEDPGALFATVLAVRGGFGLLFAMLVPAVALATGYLPEARWLLLAFVAIEFLGVVAETYVALCEGFERMGRSALITFSRSLSTFTGVIVVSLRGGGLAAFVAVYLVSQTVQLVMAIALARGAAPPLRLQLDLARVVPLLRGALWFVGVGLTSSALGSLAVLGLARLATPAETARYGAALNFFELVVMLPVLVQRVLLPVFSRLWISGDAPAVAMNSLHVIAALLFPAGVGLALLADPILALYPSGEFGDAAAVLRVLGLWVVFLAPSYVGASFLTGAGRLGMLVSVNLIAIAVQGLLLVSWVPVHGAVGAACAALVAFAVVAAVQLQACRMLGVRVPWAALLRAAAAALAMGALLWPLRQGPLYLSVPFGVAIYALVFFAIAPREGLERRLLAEGRLLWRRA